MLKTNWHTHTMRCHHATGTDEEYVLAAIQAGVKTLGFSDHAPYPSVHDVRDRMNPEDLEDYRQSILSLKEKYKDQIRLYCGLEVECFPDQWESLSQYRQSFDYCILGQHSTSFHGVSAYCIRKPEDLRDYIDAIAYGCEHSLCDYIAHPDVALWDYAVLDESVRTAAERLAEISLYYNMPLEVNAGSGVKAGKQLYLDGYRYPYPTRLFFEIFAEKGCAIIPGLDIHDPKLFLTDRYLNRAMSVLEGLNCRILYDYDLPAAAAERKKRFY